MRIVRRLFGDCPWRFSMTVLVLSAVTGAAFDSRLAAARDSRRGEKTKAWEATLTIPTYAWHNDRNPVFSEYEGKIYYPYARQDHVDAESRYWLGKTLLALGRIDQARAALEKGAGQDSANEHVKQCIELLEQLPSQE